MNATNYTPIPDDQLSTLYTELSQHQALTQVIEWVIANKAPFPTVVAQDEYTLDVVVRGRDGLVVVYDTT
jgi:hypothetical protein